MVLLDGTEMELRNMKKRFIIGGVASLALINLLPVMLTFSNSFIGEMELKQLYTSNSARLKLIPQQVTLDGYFELLFISGRYLQMFWQSATIAICISSGSTVVSFFVGFVLAKITMCGGQILRFLYTLMMLLPYQVTLLPNYMMIRAMGLYNTRWALILPGIFAPLSVFLVSQFM